MCFADRRVPRASRLAVFLLLAASVGMGGACAQSLDAKHPTPLGPGINRGTIVNDVPAHYYSFVAGPGHVDIDTAFKEMGIFGSPFRQVMNFDFYKEDGTLSVHRVIVSQGVLARDHVDGDLPTRQRFTLAVSAQRGVIKLGGYYEIVVKGATFDGPAVGAGVTPQDSTPLVKSVPGQ